MKNQYLNEVVFDVTGSAPSFLEVHDSMRGVWEKLLSSEEGKKIETILDFGAAKFRNTLHFLNEGKKVTAVEFEELPNKSEDAKKMLDKCIAKPNFQHLVFPYPFIEDGGKYDLVLLVNVLPVMPIFAERLIVLDMLYDKVNNNKYVLWYAQQEKGYKDIKEKGKNDFGDGLWMGVQKKFKTFYKYHSREDVIKMFALFGFNYVKKYASPGNDVLLFQKTSHNLFRGILTPDKIVRGIPLDDSIEEPSKIKFKRVKISEEKKEIIPNPYCLSIEKLYSEALKAIPVGTDGAEKYHRLVSQIVLRIFRGSLRNMDIKVSMFNDRKIIDTVYTNAGGFFTHMANDLGIKCPYILRPRIIQMTPKTRNSTKSLGD